MIIDYSATRTFLESLVVDDPGNCAIYGAGSFRDGRMVFEGDYYLIVKTVMGKTTFIKWGPVVPDLDTLPNTFKLEVKTSSYKESIVVNEIKGFINDSFKNIVKAEVITVWEALTKLPQKENFDATLE